MQEVETTDYGATADEPGPGPRAGSVRRGFPRYSEQEIRRWNALQADFFGKCKHLFDPPLPEGVPGRLRRIVESAGIRPTDRVLDVGTGTGILIPLIKEHRPAALLANDLSRAMLESVKARHPSVTTIHGDVRDIGLPSGSVDVIFVNACYSNIVDKDGAFRNLRRLLRPGGRLVISHPMGRSFIQTLRDRVPFPLDDFPSRPSEAAHLFEPYGLRVSLFLDEKALYILRLEPA